MRGSHVGSCVTGWGGVLTQGPLQTGRQGVEESLPEVLAHEDVEHGVETAVEEGQRACWVHQDVEDFVLAKKQHVFQPDCA